jgi:hypothetical protein
MTIKGVGPKKVTGMRTSSSKQNWCSRDAGSLRPEKISIKHSGPKWESKLRRLYKGCGYFLQTNVLRFPLAGEQALLPLETTPCFFEGYR